MLPGLALRPLPTEKPVTTFDLTLIMAETEDGLSGAHWNITAICLRPARLPAWWGT